MSDFTRRIEVVAKKAHRCDEAGARGCRRTADIRPGTRYARLSGLFDGMFWHAKLCLRCARLHGKVIRRFRCHPDDGPAIGDLAEWLRGNR